MSNLSADRLFACPPVKSCRSCVLIALLITCCSLSDLATAEDAQSTFNPEIESAQEKPLDEDTDEELLPRVEIDLSKGSVEEVANRLLSVMTRREKVGQLCQVAPNAGKLPESLKNDLRRGRIGSLFYVGDADQIIEAKRIATEESRLGIPLLTPRDVIHGFQTVFPIPVGQAASWNLQLIEEASTVAANEAQAVGINWTFAPMIDISRDARWGRIAESVGEDPVLASAITAAMIRGYQQPVESPNGDIVYRGIAACAKHFAGYGLTEGGRDYNRAEVSISELYNVILPPFHSAVQAKCATFMTSFSTLNGVPGTAHRELLTDVLKGRWAFEGFVVSDWGSVIEMIDHGYAANRLDAAKLAIRSGVDMEMASTSFQENMISLIESGTVKESTIDEAVLRVLKIKLLFSTPERRTPPGSENSTPDPMTTARSLAQQSCVLLKNNAETLPLQVESLKRVAVIGPLADAARDQLGCWMLDGKPEQAVTPLTALREALEGKVKIDYAPGLTTSLDTSTDQVEAAKSAAARSDIALVFVGEGWNLSGEARSRADIGLPGAQNQLVEAVVASGKPVVLIVLAGRPLTIGAEAEKAEAVLYAWHPGSQGGPAIADLLLGIESPSGKLPVTFPKHVGQSPLYYNHPNTGRPPLVKTKPLIGSGLADYPDQQKYRSHYLDVDPFPLFPFGYGLSYAIFEYGKPELSTKVLQPGQTLGVRCSLTNTGKVVGEEVVQLYVQDTAASLVRPVRELKAFRRVRLEPGEKTIVEFALTTDQLAFFDNQGRSLIEPGTFRIGVGGDSTVPLNRSFKLQDNSPASKLIGANP